MQNLEQIRAKNALEQSISQSFSGANDGEVVKKVPVMIQKNGLLPALAFAINDKIKRADKPSGYEEVFKTCIIHLKSLKMIDTNKNLNITDFCNELSRGSAENLRAITSEILAYLNYLRRFAEKKKNN